MSAPKPTEDDFFDPALWISVKDLAAMMGIRTQSLYNKIKTKDVPQRYSFDGRRTRFYKPEVRAWFLKHRRIPLEDEIAEAIAKRHSSELPKPLIKSAQNANA